MKLYFSAHPGSWERQLQRQCDNSLFSHLPPITQSRIDDAQRKDEAERRTFMQVFQNLLQQVADLDAQVKVEVVLKLKDQIEVLYEQCAAIGGHFTAEKRGLNKLHELIIQSILENVTLDQNTKNQLLQEVAEQKQHADLLEYPLVAHLLHPQSPIPQDEIVPTLLTEDEASLRAAMSLFAIPQKQILYQEAKQLLTRLKGEGYLLPSSWQRLEVIEQLLKEKN